MIQKQKNRLIGFFKLALAFALFGVGSIFVKSLQLDTITLLWSVTFISVLVITLLSVAKKNRIHRPTKHLLGLGLIHLLTLLFTFLAIRNASVANALLTRQLAPIILLLLAPLWIKEHETWKSATAGFLGIAGIFILVGSSGIFLNSDGFYLALAAAACLASEIILRRELRKYEHITTLATAFWQQFLSLIILLPFVKWGSIYSGVISGSFTPVIFFGLLVSIAMLFMVSSMKKVQAHQAGILSYIEPLTAIVLAALLLKEPITTTILIGGLLILSAGLFELSETATQS